MKNIIIYAAVLSLFLSSQSDADDWQQFMRETSAPVFAQEQLASEPSTVVVNEKNPKLAFVLSAIVPGTGQIYAKSYWQAAGFFALEALSWTMYAVYTNEGQDIEDEFHQYANKHWSESEYWRWIAYQSGKPEDDMEALREWESGKDGKFSHGLHRQKDQQYYEMIGKYHQFNYGWDDFREDYPIDMSHEEMTAKQIVSDNRYFYESRRNASNDAFKKATTGTTIAMLNHLLSAVHAAWATTKFNKQINMSLQFEPIYFNQHTQTVLAFRVTW